MNKNYNLKLDLQFRCNNQTMEFNQFDNNTSDFFMKISSGGKSFDVEKAIVVLAAIKPSGKVASQFVEVENGLVYADLKPNMKDEIGTYTAQAMLILEDERVVTDAISYEVEEDKIFSLLNDTVEATEEFTLLTDMLSRLSTIEISEEQRVINEAERILSEENRKTEEAKRVEAELVRQHEEADRAKYDATRESNENIRKQNESIRLANETNRIDEEAKRVEEENKRKLAEEERNANYNFMTEDEERRRSEANAHKEAEVLRVQAETNRVNEEVKRRTTEQARVSAENTRVGNENTREANEVTRQTNETQRVEAETQRQSRYNSFITDAEANANNFESYTNTAKVKEEERKANELDRKSQEARRVSNEVERISNEETRKANEEIRESNEISRQNVFENKVDEFDEKIVELNTTKENFISSVNTKVDTKISEIDKSKSDMTTTVSNKVNEVETRFNALTSSQQQSSEVIDARDGETSLKARLDRDIEKAKQIYVNVEGSNISTDSSVGYAKDVEILGNTIQDASNLADIRSVGDTVEGQELYEIPVVSCGKNLLNLPYTETNKLVSNKIMSSEFSFSVTPGKTYTFSMEFNIVGNNGSKLIWAISYDKFYGGTNGIFATVGVLNSCTFTATSDTVYFIGGVCETSEYWNFKLEEGTQATPYEPYQEDKLTILSPVQLEKVGDVADRIIEKDGVWGVEKNVETVVLNGSENWHYDTFTKGYYTFLPNLIADATMPITNRYLGVLNIKGIGQCHLGGPEGNKNGNLVINHDDGVMGTTVFKEYVALNNITVKYPTSKIQFIPLPHDQQVKLRTFANKTNISFGCEIEGTIKAQVPKSLGATVNTHTEQINNLNKELDRVKKLEESTVSTVTTESDFTTVEQTSNGYFEDVKLEGKTLVNKLNPISSIMESDTTFSAHTNTILEPNVYTIINNSAKEIFFNINNASNGEYITTITLKNTEKSKILNYGTQIKIVNFGGKKDKGWNENNKGDLGKQIILEGDHTQNPPSYFEGLKSVGQSATTSEDGVDEIVVESVNGNLFDLEKWIQGVSVTRGNIQNHYNGSFTLSSNADDCHTGIVTSGVVPLNERCKLINIEGINKLTVSVSKNNTSGSIMFYGLYDKEFNVLGFNSVRIDKLENTHIITNNYSNAKYFMLRFGVEVANNSITFSNIIVSRGDTPKPYTTHQSDKKRLLYYNNETQTWEKPVLREWDSIEKHADGKYYYHQRSGEVVLNGENGSITKGSDLDSTCYFEINDINLKALLLKPTSNTLIANILCDKLNINSIQNLYATQDTEGIGINTSGLIGVRINKSKLSTQDVQGFKQWLQTNNVTVVYQLAQEKVYECTNIDLITYANETNYIVDCGAIAPKSTLKVHNNISNVVSLLQKKVSLLESNVKASQEVQDMMILETDMRMLYIELALMEFIPMTLNLGGSNMLRSATYFNFLKNHIINETYEKEYLENVMNKYLATGRINQDEYNELYKMLYPPVYDIELPIEY